MKVILDRFDKRGLRCFRVFAWAFGVAMLLARMSAPASAQNATSTLRRLINNENPLFVYSSVYHGADQSQLENFWAALPDDVKPYFGVHINPKKTDSKDNREWIESILETARRIGAPAIIETEGFNSQNDTPMEYWEELFDKYPNLIGLNISEISATGGLSGANLNDEFMRKIARYIEVAASRGGYFIWQDMSWDAPFPKSPHVFVKAGTEPVLFNAIKDRGAHVILTHKHNGNGRRFTSDAAAMGFWASGITAAWGTHSEGWLWWEGGFEKLYEPSKAPHRSATPWKSVFSYPDALYGIEWMIAASGGASLFSLEAYFQGYSSCDGKKLTPAFENVILPLIRQIIKHRFIPDRDSALAKIKTAYRPSQAAPRALREDHLFKSLYGPEYSSHYEWLPSTGRYYFIPIIPMLAEASTDALFQNVIDDGIYKDNLVSPVGKKKYFDALYPAEGEGDAWFVNVGGNWLVANPNENLDIPVSFDLPLSINAGARVSGVLSPHTFAIIHEGPGRVFLHLSNYRVDSSVDVWNNDYLNQKQPCDYVADKYISNPTDNVARRTMIALSGFTGGIPDAIVNIGQYGEYKIEHGEGALHIKLDHNGTMDVEIVLGSKR
ncbi:MAG: Glycosyl hydrolase family 98 [bacterium ADurb.Bin236]|nr:MAG: Glycosyl hydrolase family 98 [bacterium ADurb.Bin236]HOY62773.1 glycoside hydrolase family 98 domain-containing protein [bacterium]